MMQTRPSARFRARTSNDRSTCASATAGAVAGVKDGAELDDNDPVAAWLEHVEDGGVDTPEGKSAFEAAYRTAYARSYRSSEFVTDASQAAQGDR